jgi:WD domain, G-beta repeat
VRIWDTSSGRCLASLNSHEDWVYSLCVFSSLIFSASKDGSIKVWDSSTGTLVKSLVGHQKESVFTVIVANETLYSGGDDGRVLAWDIEAETYTVVAASLDGGVNALLSHDDTIISATSNGFTYTHTPEPSNSSLIMLSNEISISRTSSPSNRDSLSRSKIDALAIFGTDTQSGQTVRVADWESTVAASRTSSQSGSRPNSPRPISTSRPNSPRPLSAGGRESPISATKSTATVHERERPKSAAVMQRSSSMVARSVRSNSISQIPLARSVSGTPSLARSVSGSQALRRRSGLSSLSASHSVKTDSSTVEELEEELQKSHELITKKERLNMRLKAEVTSTRNELAQAKSELDIVRKQLDSLNAVKVLSTYTG